MAPRTPTHKVQYGQFYTASDVAAWMIAQLDAPQGARVLESGAGEGAFVHELIQAGYTNIDAAEFDAANCEILREKFPHVQVLEGDYTQLAPIAEYDAVIGNPPYVSWNNIPLATRQHLTQDPFWKPRSNGEWDLLYAFITLSMAKLKEGGELIYIVPYNWFNSTYAAGLRREMAQLGQFELFAHFGEFKLFEDCYPNVLIFKWRKLAPGARRWPLVKAADFTGRKGDPRQVVAQLAARLNKDEPAGPFEKHEGDWHLFTTHQLPDEGFWYLAAPSQQSQVEALEEACGADTVGSAARVGVGLVSGYDAAYLVDDDLKTKLGKEAQDLCHELVKARGLSAYEVEASTTYLMPPDDITSEADFAQRYPLAYAHLRAHQTELSARHLAASKDWWQWATIRNMDLFSQGAGRGKVFVPSIDRRGPRFAWSAEVEYAAGDVLTILPHSDDEQSTQSLWLCAWLGSDVVQSWYAIKGSKTGQRVRYTQAYVQQIPLLVPRSDAELAIQRKACGLVAKIQAGEDRDQLHQDLQELIGKMIELRTEQD